MFNEYHLIMYWILTDYVSVPKEFLYDSDILQQYLLILQQYKIFLKISMISNPLHDETYMKIHITPFIGEMEFIQ